MTADTLYSIIGVAPDADVSVLRKAVRKALRETHPDLNSGRTDERYYRVQEAADTLLDERARAAYDRELGAGGSESVFAGVGADTAEAGAGAQPGSSRQRRNARRAAADRAGRPRFDHDVPIIPVRARFDMPQTSEVLSPAPGYGRRGPWLSLITCTVLVAAAAVLFHDLWFTGALSELGAVEMIASAISRTLKTAALAVVVFAAVARALRWSIAGLGILAGVLGLAIILFSTRTGSSLALICMFVFVIVGVISFIGFGSTSRTRSGAYLLPVDVSANVRTYGEPGLGLASSGFEDAAVRAGVQGERASAEVIERHISRIPGVRTFHSMRFAPGSRADVDHVLVSGSRLAIIDSKLWPSAHYEWESGITGTIIENNPRGTRRMRETRLIEARRSYREMFPKHEVQVWVLIHPASGAGGFSVSNSFCPDGVRMGSADSVVNEVGQWLAEESQDRAVIDRVVLNRLGILIKD